LQFTITFAISCTIKSFVIELQNAYKFYMIKTAFFLELFHFYCLSNVTNKN